MSPSKRGTLQYKILCIVGLPLLCMLFAGVFLGYLASRERSLEQLAISLEERTARQAAELNLFFGSMARYADNLAQTIDAVGVLSPTAESVLTREAVKTGDLGSCTIAYAMDPLTERPLYPSPSTYRLGTIPVQVYLPPEKGASYVFQDWFLMPQLAGRGRWTDPYYSDRQRSMVVAYGAPFTRAGAFFGVASIATTTDSILKKLDDINAEGSQLVLVSKFGTVVAHPDPDVILRHTLVSLASARGSQELEEFAYAIRGHKAAGVVQFANGVFGPNEYVAYAPVAQTGWTLLSVVPETVVTTPLQHSLMIAMSWCTAGALVLFIVITALGSRELVVPMQRLSRVTSRLASGDFSVRVTDFSTTEELYQLEETFNSTAAQLDASMQKQVEAARAASYAEEASKAKSDFLARMSHEIRTPMNAVLGFTHIALSRSPAPEQQEFLLKIQSAGKNMLSIINDILDFSKIEAGKLDLENSPFSFSTVAADISNLFSTAAGQKGLAFTVCVDDTLPPLVQGDALRVAQILMNLCNNAIKFTHEGFIRVHIAHEGLDEAGRLTVGLHVQDSGMGIAPEVQEHLFDKFAQADSSTTRRFGGTGLGLAICRLLAELMGGGIEVVSRVGEGSTFSARVVCGVVAHAPEGTASAHAGAPAGTPGTTEAAVSDEAAVLAKALVLVVEDNEINQEIIAALLEAMGVTYKIAADGQEAVDMMQLAVREGQPYDLVLMDMQMPRMDGVTATRTLRARGFILPILAMTANAMRADREQCLAAGMNDHLPKPIEPDGLRALLIRHLCGKP